MQKTNYQFEKRRREMEKKAKKEEKRRQHLEAARSPAATNTAAPAAPPSRRPTPEPERGGVAWLRAVALVPASSTAVALILDDALALRSHG